MCGRTMFEGEHEAPVGVPTCVMGGRCERSTRRTELELRGVVPARRSGESEAVVFACTGLGLRLSVILKFGGGGNSDDRMVVMILW